MNTNDKQDMNRDPITGAPGSHPLGTGVGATGGALAGPPRSRWGETGEA